MINRLLNVMVIFITFIPKMLLLPIIAAIYYVITANDFFLEYGPGEYLAWPLTF